MPYQLSMNKLRNLNDTPVPELIGYRKIIQCLNKTPTRVKEMTYNNMAPVELYTNLLLDNPKINYCKSFLEYVKYLKTIIDEVKSSVNGQHKIQLFGLEPHESWKSLSCRDHLLEIAVKDGLFWEFISWDCPFVITLLISIQNNDIDTLLEYIKFYECIESEHAIYIFEYLVKYAYDFRRLGMIEQIIYEFLPYLMRDDINHMIGDCLGSLMKYFSENYINYNPRNVITDDADIVKLIDILEICFPDIYKYFQIEWSGYLYQLVRLENTDKIMELASKMEKPYFLLDYEIVIYAMSKNMDAIVSILLTGFEWNDNRDTEDKKRFEDLNKSELEKIVYYLLQNIENSQNPIETGFDPSSVCFSGKLAKESHRGINTIYNKYEKRFHMNVYLKSVDTRGTIMEKWCGQTGVKPEAHYQSVFNDMHENMDFRNALEKVLIKKLNFSLLAIDSFHETHNNIQLLIHQFANNCQIMYKYEQYNDPNVKVV